MKPFDQRPLERAYNNVHLLREKTEIAEIELGYDFDVGEKYHVTDDPYQKPIIIKSGNERYNVLGSVDVELELEWQDDDPYPGGWVFDTLGRSTVINMTIQSSNIVPREKPYTRGEKVIDKQYEYVYEMEIDNRNLRRWDSNYNKIERVKINKLEFKPEIIEIAKKILIKKAEEIADKDFEKFIRD